MRQGRSWLLLVLVVVCVAILASSDPQVNLLNNGCSQYKPVNLANFNANLKESFVELRRQISNDGKLFATAQHATRSDAVYAMFQCRDYLSVGDCVACFDAALSQIRNCSNANGARVIYDGCFLRYESNNFYSQSTLPGNTNICGNQTATQRTAVAATVERLLEDLEVATLRIDGFSVATKREVANSSITIYAVAQCVRTLSQNGCQDCLAVALGNIKSCLPDSDGKAIDAGCFLRYSETPFFANNQTKDIRPFLAGGTSRKMKVITGVVAGVVGFTLLLFLSLLLWCRLSKQSMGVQRGHLLGATELQGPTRYHYKDLKSATKNFSEKNKLGEGGYGAVYKAKKKGLLLGSKGLI